MVANYLGFIVEDIEQATAFFRDTLGFPIDQKESIPGQYTQFNFNGGMILSLQGPVNTADPELNIEQPFEPAVMVTDVDGLAAEWQGKGVTILDGPRDMPFGRAMLVQTPYGHAFRVYQPAV